MEAIIFTGLPGSGKSSFYKERFFNSHVRISLDLLKTRHRETRLLDVCLETDQRFVKCEPPTWIECHSLVISDGGADN